MERLLYRNESEAVEDGGGFVDKSRLCRRNGAALWRKWSGSVAEMERLCGGNGVALWRKWSSSGEAVRGSVEGNGVVRA